MGVCMKKILLYLSIAFLVIISVRAKSFYNPIPYDINIREKPSPNSTLLDTLNKDEQVEVIEVLGGWLHINYNESTAYIYREELLCNAIYFAPLPFSIPVNHPMQWSPDFIISNNLTISQLSIPKLPIQVILLIFIFSILLSYTPQFRFIRKQKRQKKIRHRYKSINELNLANTNPGKIDAEFAKDDILNLRQKEVVLNEVPLKTMVNANSQNIQRTTTANKSKPTPKVSKDKKTNERHSIGSIEPYPISPSEVGELFEGFIVDCFDCKPWNLKSTYILEKWTSDKSSRKGIYAQSNKEPDLQLRKKGSSQSFLVECKYRTSDNISLEASQLRRYKTFGVKNNMPVFLAIGTGGSPIDPEKVYLIPLNRVDIPDISNTPNHKELVDLNAVKYEYQRNEPGAMINYVNVKRLVFNEYEWRLV